jgi:acyl dehydratase
MMSQTKSGYGRWLEEFQVGEIYRHEPGHTVLESDNNLFCLLTYNHHPVHLDWNYAGSSQHGKVLVVGTYVLSLIVGMSVADTSGRAIANLEYENIRHNAPVFLGDTLYGESEVLEIRESNSKPDRGVVYIETRGFNQRHERVLTLRRKILIPKKP